MRKFKTKHGFTIVEVLVAFVIFAIMASMVSAILSTTMKTKQENIEIEKEILDQQTAYYVNTNLDNRGDNSDKTYTDGTLTLNFTGGNVPAGGIAINNISVDNVEPTDNVADNALTLEYYVGNVNYNTLTVPPTENPGNGTPGSITERIDSRIYGANKLNKLEMNIVKDLSYTDAHKYFISFKTDSEYGDHDTTIESIFKYFSQLRFNFTSNNQVLDCGYVEMSGDKFLSQESDWLSGNLFADVEIVPTSPYSVRISGLQEKDKSLQVITDKRPGVYIVLAKPLDNTLASFALSESDTEKDLTMKSTTIGKKSIDENYNISSGSGNFTVGEATAYIADLRAKRDQLYSTYLITASNDVDESGNNLRNVYSAKLDMIDAEIDNIAVKLRNIQYPLDANKIFGYTTSKEEFNTESNKFVYKEYITYDKDNNATVQPGVLGGYKKAETTTTPSTSTPEPEETE